MTPDPEQVEAHAAQGYSLPDVARLLGLPFFNQNNPESKAAIDAFNRGAARWRDNGQPIPPRATDIIAQAVHSQLLSKEMTRPQLKEALGFRHDDLNLAVETLEAQFLIEHREDNMGTLFYRGAGTPAAKPERATAPAPAPAVTRASFIETLETVSRPLAENNGVNETSQPEPNSNGQSDIVGNKPEKISARSEAPKRNFEVFDSAEEGATVGNGSKFGISVNGEVRKIVEALSGGTETDTPRLLIALLAAHPQLKDHPETLQLRNYVSQAVSPLKGKVLELVRKGRGGEADVLRRVAETAVSPKTEKNITRTIPAKPEQLVPAERELPSPNGHNYQVKYEGLTIFCDTQDEVVAIVSRLHLPATAPASIEPPVALRRIKRAWSKDFEDDDAHGEGVPGMTMLYLVSLFHDGMEEHEKEAVFTLIRYLKRIQAANEAASEAKKEANA